MARRHRRFGPFLHSTLIVAVLILIGMGILLCWPFGHLIWERHLLAKQLRHTSATMRWQAARDLLSEHGASAAAILLEALDDPNPEVRVLVCSRLGWVRPVPTTAVVGLLKRITDTSAAVRQAAVESLGGSTQASVLVNPGPARQAVVTALRRALRDPEDRVRLASSVALAKFGRGAWDAIPELTASLNAPDRNHRYSAARALLRIERRTNAAAITTLQAIVTDPYKTGQPARVQVAKTLCEANPEEAAAILPALIGWLRGSDRALCESALLCMLVYGPIARPALPALESLLVHDADMILRYHTVMAIRSVDRDAGLSALQMLRQLAEDPSLRPGEREIVHSTLRKLEAMIH